MITGLIDAIDAVLPQTQCTRCGYPDCHTYANAVATGTAPINQCPPGGQATIGRLAALLQTEAIPLNPAFGVEGPRTAAVIDEERCIGCTLCIQACPVDAIVGTAKRMHTVLTAYCSGCDLCLAPCPVDCIDMIELEHLATRGNAHANSALELSIEEMAPVFRNRFVNHQRRALRQREERERRLAQKGHAQAGSVRREPATGSLDKKAAIIAAALKRARARHGIDT